MPETTVRFKDEWYEVVTAYQQENDLKSFSEAARQLITRGLQSIGKQSPEPIDWGGWRDNPKSLKNLLPYVDKLTDYGRNDPTE